MMTHLVLDLTRLLPGPLAGRMLAEIGYEVRRIVPPEGDLMAAASPEGYAWLNAGKTSETIDLKTPAGGERLRELACDATILLETNRPGVMEKLGIGPESLRRLNPKLTYVRLAGYREPAFHQAPGHDLAYLAADGLLDRFENVWREMQVADATGAFWAVIAAQEGVRRGGGFFEVYMSETARSLAYPALPGLDGSALCYGTYPTAQGQVALTALEPHLWQRFCEHMERPDWSSEAFTPANANNPIWIELCQALASRTADEWESWAMECKIPLRMVKPPRLPEQLLPWLMQ